MEPVKGSGSEREVDPRELKGHLAGRTPAAGLFTAGFSFLAHSPDPILGAYPGQPASVVG